MQQSGNIYVITIVEHGMLEVESGQDWTDSFSSKPGTFLGKTAAGQAVRGNPLKEAGAGKFRPAPLRREG